MNVIYVDDEKLQHMNFRLTAEEMDGIDSLETFGSSIQALKWAEQHPVDVAFLDIEMPVMNGIELAGRLRKLDENIRIIFVTAYEQYALQAFSVDAVGYLLKPYSAEDIAKNLKKASRIRSIPQTKIRIETMPNLLITTAGTVLRLGHTKQEELLALLVDRGVSGLTKKDAVEDLWEGYSSDSIYWTTMSRLKKELEEAGMQDLVVTKGQTKYINTAIVECDLYRMLQGEMDAVMRYQGKYLDEYGDKCEWINRRKKQLDDIRAAAGRIKV